MFKRLLKALKERDEKLKKKRLARKQEKKRKHHRSITKDDIELFETLDDD